MYKCEDCGFIFDSPLHPEDCYTECPICSSDNTINTNDEYEYPEHDFPMSIEDNERLSKENELLRGW